MNLLNVAMLACISIATSPLPGISAELIVQLYDSNSRPLSRGDAILMIEKINTQNGQAEWTKYVAKAVGQPYYFKRMPDVHSYNLTIYTNQFTRKREINGIFGKANHNLHLLADPKFMATCGSFQTEYGASSEHLQLLDQLDRAFPNGTPPNLTNIRDFLRNAVLKPLENREIPTDAGLRRKRDSYRSRIVRHLQ